MASKPRQYQADVPVEITQRCNLRLKLLRDPSVKRELARLMAKNLERCEVDLVGWNISPDNHLHWIIVQHFNGHDRRREKGIAPFVRNVTSGLARAIGDRFKLEGRVAERTYRSNNLDGAESLLRALAYLHGQRRHHGLPEGSEQWSSASVYLAGEPDGLVTCLPDLLEDLGDDPTARIEALAELIEDIIDRALAMPQEAAKAPARWRRATQEALAGGGLRLRADGRAATPVHAVLGNEPAHEAARRRLRDYVFPRGEVFDPNQANPDDLLTLLVRWYRAGGTPTTH